MTVLAVSGTPSPSLRPGISFARASKSYSPLTISAVAKDGLFGRSPLVPGVVVLKINDQEATWMHPQDAKKLVKSGEPISITVEAFIAKIVRKKRLDKLGIVLKESKGEKGLLIEEIGRESPFANTDLKPGMKIVNINGARCPNRPKEAIRLMQKIFGTMKVVAVQTNRDTTTERNQHAEVAMNWTLSNDSVDSKREAQVKRKVELKRKLSKQGDKFSMGLDKLESSLTRLESSVKGSTGVVRSRTENSETPLELRMTDPSASEDVQRYQATKSKETTGKDVTDGYTLRKTGSYICDLDECNDEPESEKSSSKHFSFQQSSPVNAITQLRKIGRKKKQTVVVNAAETDHDADDATGIDSATTASKYFNFDVSPSEAMAKLKKKTKTPTSKGRRKKEKEKRNASNDVKSPTRARTVDFAGQVRQVSKKAKEKLQSSLASTHQEAADPDESLVTGKTRVSPSKAAALARKLPFGRKSAEQIKQETEVSKHLRQVQVIQTHDDEMGMEVCIAEPLNEGQGSHGDLSVEGIVVYTESSDSTVVTSDPDQANPDQAKTEEEDTEVNVWPSQDVKAYADTTLAFAGLTILDPKRASSPRNLKETEQSDVSAPASKTVVMNFDDIPKEQKKEAKKEAPVESNIEEASIQETPSQEVSTTSSYSGSDGEYSDESESDSEYDSSDDDDSGSEGDWSEDSSESVDEKDKLRKDALPLQHLHKLSSRSDFGDNESRADHFGGSREALHPTNAISTPVETMDSSDEGEQQDFQVVTVTITKASRDDVLGFKVFQYEDRDGIFISDIDEYSGLLHRGLKPGMQVTKVNGKTCPNNFSEAVTLIKNTIGVVEIEATAGHRAYPTKPEKSIISTAVKQIPSASSSIEQKMSDIFSGVLSVEDKANPELIVKIC
mmetsp:Transcript_28244/g.68724  ORF Transcript_28244/g.68724 Transcript_28244/m.68724 type:complete len:898 (+) Transcript_28244:121-2814(+)|eukprot:CAMPEP_0113619364 /NCGR_PEP_ID=MMETSP0017_2-20120614/9830_1 /TAXON_ID=2856 /ORGANISM="Cylindrotheca closterium" /LENGTH=897 /DNA_ID=CAMNT_0000528933 /DNA_START=72 /DNA_END=2765 /DNA_ORIENTATION=- /assembly_acc=CAM_ASM_000147